MGKFDEQLMELAGVQHFVVSRSQLLEIGTRDQIEHRVRSGYLERVFESVYRLRGSPPVWRQLLMAATFAGGKFSVASFRAAAALSYLPGGEEWAEITSLRHHRARHEHVLAHESRFLEVRDLMYIDNIPVTRTARTLNDLALLVDTGEMTPGTLEHALHDAVRRSLVDIDRVWREWERLGGRRRPGGPTMERLLQRFVPPARTPDSNPEIKLLQMIRDAGLPEPVPQFRVWLSETRWADLDFGFPEQQGFAEFDPYKFHGNRDKYMKDARRRLELRDLGWDGVSITDDELDSGGALAMRVLGKILAEKRR
jgi:hypothetical protein